MFEHCAKSDNLCLNTANSQGVHNVDFSGGSRSRLSLVIGGHWGSLEVIGGHWRSLEVDSDQSKACSVHSELYVRTMDGMGLDGMVREAPF